MAAMFENAESVCYIDIYELALFPKSEHGSSATIECLKSHLLQWDSYNNFKIFGCFLSSRSFTAVLLFI